MFNTQKFFVIAVLLFILSIVVFIFFFLHPTDYTQNIFLFIFSYSLILAVTCNLHYPVSKSIAKVDKGWINTDPRSPRATKFCTVAPNICVSSIWKLHHVNLLSPRILRWLLDFQTHNPVHFRTNFINIYFGPTHVIKGHNVLTIYYWKSEAHPLSYVVNMMWYIC